MGWYADIKTFDVVLRNVSEDEMLKRCVKAGLVSETYKIEQPDVKKIDLINDALWPFVFDKDIYECVEVCDELQGVECKNPDRFLYPLLFDDGSMIEFSDEYGYFCYTWSEGSVYEQNAEIIWHKDPFFLVSDGRGAPVAIFRERWAAENYFKEKLNYIGSCTEVEFFGNTKEVRDENGTV